MYYEEALIDGAWYWRGTPTGDWVPMGHAKLAEKIAALQQSLTKTVAHTRGPWRVLSMGGSSTVIASTSPARNDTRIPAIAYDESKGHCIGYPFLDDAGQPRLDFVNFSHDDARVIAAAPDLLAAAKLAKAALIHDLVEPGRTAFWALVEAINKAEGK